MDITKNETFSSSISVNELADSMKQKRFHEIKDPMKRQQAIYDHLMSVMIDTIHDRTKAADLAATRVETVRDYGGASPTLDSIPVEEVK